MPQYRIKAPDGKEFIVNAPEGASQDQVLEYAKSQWGKEQSVEQPATPDAAPKEAKMPGDSVGRQAGLFTRSALKGVAGIPMMVTEPIRNLIVNPIASRLGLPQAAPLTGSADAMSDALGLPTPRTSQERIVGKGVEMGLGAAGMGGAAKGAADLLAQGAGKLAPSVTQKVLSQLGTGLGTQAAAGAAGGMAGEQAKESGGGAMEQFAATVLGGLGGAGLASLGKSAASGVRDLASRLTTQQATAQAVDQRVINILVNAGVDPKSIGPAVLSKMREDVKAAMNTGGALDDAAVARLADYARTGLTPTRGGVTLDPYDVTLQQNAMKMAAATGSRDARLPTIANQNATRLLDNVQGLGAHPDSFAAGSNVISNIVSRDAAMGAEKTNLYNAARALAGGDIPLDRAPFVNAAFSNLAKENKMAFLPSEIGDMLNQISVGQITKNGQTFEVPFNVNTLDTLKTMLASASRSSKDGNAKAAIKAVRDALEAVPLAPTKPGAGGSALVTPQTAAAMQAGDSAPSALMQALDKARSAAKQQFDWQESAPGIERALSGAIPETFIQQNVIAKTAGYKDVAKLAANLDSAGMESVKGSIVQHLLESSIGKGRNTDTAKFSGVGLQKALNEIGDRKLRLFFSADELEMLKSTARVAQYETFQPTGSAVNNSNTGAAVARLAQSLGKAKLLPGVNAVLGPALDSGSVWMMERPALAVSKGLLSPGAAQGSFAAGLLPPALYGAGSLLPSTP